MILIAGPQLHPGELDDLVRVAHKVRDGMHDGSQGSDFEILNSTLLQQISGTETLQDVVRFRDDLAQFLNQSFGRSLHFGVEFSLTIPAVFVVRNAIDNPLIQIASKVSKQHTNRILIGARFPPHLVGCELVLSILRRSARTLVRQSVPLTARSIE
jgi:hypothetical protein